jgi:multidrug efflux system membrane fusion protein
MMMKPGGRWTVDGSRGTSSLRLKHRASSTVNRALSTRIAITLAIAIAACSKPAPPRADPAVPVTVATAQLKNVPVQLRAIGNVQPRSTVSIKPLASGQLLRVWFREGEDVRRGQVLFTIDPRPYQAALAQAQANLARDQANLRNAESEAGRYSELVKKDYVTREEYEKFTSAAAAARAVVAADRASIQTTQVDLSYCEIRSPVDGRTGSLQVHPGNVVRANDTTALVVINQIHPVYVQFSVPEAQLRDVQARVRGGSVPVEVSPQSGGAPLATGTLSFVDNAVDPTTGTIALKATFDNANGALWPGQYVNIAVTLSNRENAVVIPSQAVQSSQKGQYVYVVKNDKGVEMRPITVLQAVDQQTIVDRGVAPGETVVTDGQIRLTPKSKVEIKTTL